MAALTIAQASKRIQKIADELRELVDCVQEYYDDRSEKWQDSEQGEKYQGMIDGLDTAIEELEGLCEE